MRRMIVEPEEIHVLDRRVRLLQPPGGFRTSLDSVMVAAACPAKPGDRVLDMGAGVGGAAFCLLVRVPDCHVTGVEIQPAYHALAESNIAINGAEGKADFVLADVLAWEATERFDQIVCNPPYLEAGTYTEAEDKGKRAALGHARNDLEDWTNAAHRLLKSNGTLTLIHRADMLDKIILALGKRFGATEVIPLWPRQGEGAKRLVVRTVKDRRSHCRLMPGLVLHDADGAYTNAADRILRRCEGL